jgi:dinuclear metal center YbgI/SA1388 family protein
MRNASLTSIVRFCDATLRTPAVNDYSGAVNGLQVQNSGRITGIAAAVDASLSTVKIAIASRCNLMIVHHGFFWSPSHPWTGKKYELLGLLLEHDVAIYSSHLPLDLHPRLGNNAGLCRALGLKPDGTFLESHGQCIGVTASSSLARSVLNRRLTRVLGVQPKFIGDGPDRCRRIGICTGGAGSELAQAAKAGLDTFITGEGPHWTSAMAEELGLNVFYGGHYATETFGVKALAAELSRKFKVPWTFLDHPSGL